MQLSDFQEIQSLKDFATHVDLRLHPLSLHVLGFHAHPLQHRFLHIPTGRMLLSTTDHYTYFHLDIIPHSVLEPRHCRPPGSSSKSARLHIVPSGAFLTRVTKLGSLLRATYSLKHWGKSHKSSFKKWHPIFCKSTSNIWIQQIRIFNNRISVINVLHILTFEDVTQLSSSLATLPRSSSDRASLHANKRRSSLRLPSSLHHVSTTSVSLTCAGFSTLNMYGVNNRMYTKSLTVPILLFDTWATAEPKVCLQHILPPV